MLCCVVCCGLSGLSRYRRDITLRLASFRSAAWETQFTNGVGDGDRFSRDRPRFTDNLDVIKFLCKDLWTVLFRKQIDNLKTNHRVCSALNIRNELCRVDCRARTCSNFTVYKIHGSVANANTCFG